LEELLRLDLQTPSKKVAPAFLKKYFSAKGEKFTFTYVRGKWSCASAHQTFISIDGMESMVDLASYNLHQVPPYDNPFEVIPLFQPLLPPIDPQMCPDIILNKMDDTYNVPFDSFLSTYYVACPRENEDPDSRPEIYLSKNLTCSNFFLEMKQADCYDSTFFLKF
jgi:hypothetical protein